MLDLVGTPEDRFTHNEAHILFSAGQVGDECAILDLASCLDPNAQCSSATSPPTCACIDGFTHNVNTRGCDLRKLSFYPYFMCLQ